MYLYDGVNLVGAVEIHLHPIAGSSPALPAKLKIMKVNLIKNDIKKFLDENPKSKFETASEPVAIAFETYCQTNYRQTNYSYFNQIYNSYEL